MTETDHIAYATDMGLVGPTAVSLYSALRSTRSIRTIHLLNISLSQAARDLFQRIAGDFERTLEWHRLDERLFELAVYKGRHVPKTALARLYLPHLVKGRVLYIDGDTLVHRDLNPLLETNLKGKLIGAVRDYGILRKEFRVLQGKPWPERGGVQKIVSPEPVQSYVNSGVLLMDTVAIRREVGLADAMLAFERTTKFDTVDQDYINELFHGRIYHLDPAWNSSWGRHAKQAGWIRRLDPCAPDGRAGPAGILHFHGPHKPWQPLNRDMLKRGPLATFAYKKTMRRFLSHYPEAVF